MQNIIFQETGVSLTVYTAKFLEIVQNPDTFLRNYASIVDSQLHKD